VSAIGIHVALYHHRHGVEVILGLTEEHLQDEILKVAEENLHEIHEATGDFSISAKDALRQWAELSNNESFEVLGVQHLVREGS